MALFSDGLLRERAIAAGGEPSEAITDALTALGARVHSLPAELDDDGVEQWAREHPELQTLLYDSRNAFGEGGLDGLRAASDRTWRAVRGVAAGTLIPAAHQGKVILVAPHPDAGAHAEAARAALENLARTLSVEWARYAVTVTAIAPGPRTSEQELATLISFLASPAGDYYTGCTLTLGAVAAATAR